MKNGWQTKRIDDVCNLATGGTPSRAKPEYFGGNIKWLVSGDIHDGEIHDCNGRITEAGMKNSNAKLLPTNSVMIALNGQGKTRGTVALLRTAATCNQSMVCLTPKTTVGLLPEFLYANLRGRYEELRHLTSDDDKDRRGLNMGLIRNIEIPIAPLAEQQRIVSVLDKAFASLCTAKAHAEKNLQNARALFESHLHRDHPQKTLLRDLVSIKTGKLDANAAVEGGKYPFFTCSREIYAIDTHAFDCEAILLAGNNAVGDFNVKHYEGKFNAYQRTYVITVNDQKRVLYRFLYFQMLKSLKKFKAQSVGAGTKFLKLGRIQDLEIGLPSLAEQQRIVSKMDSIRTETQRLETLYQTKLAALAALEKSLLHQAFSGEL
jgi:type I restriction enzyme, S subunit